MEGVAHAAVVAGDLAPAARLSLALDHELRAPALDGAVAREIVGARGDRGGDLGADVAGAVGEDRAGTLAVELLGGRAGEEAGFDEVALGRRVLLQQPERAVVVGGDEPVRGDEPCGAAADRDRRLEEPGTLGIPEGVGRQLEAELAEPRRVVLAELLGRPLALDGVQTGGNDGEKEERRRDEAGRAAARAWAGGVMELEHGGRV